MDYPNRTRFKVLGRVQMVGLEESELLAQLEMDDYRARIERGFLIHIEAFDWNCPQHITPRYTESYVESLMQPLLEENKALKSNHPESISNQTLELGDGPLDLVISGVRQLTPGIRAFELRDVDGRELPEFEAGAHLEIPFRSGGGSDDIRHYSICSNPSRRDIYEIAVLRDENGEGGSNEIHENFDIGMRLHIALPINHFALHSDERPAVLIAGGIGITPIKPMAQSLRARDNRLEIHYAARSTVDMAFRDRLQREFGDEFKPYASSQDQRIDIQSVLSNAAENAVVYVCGPGRLIDAVVSAAEALEICADRIRFERFSAAEMTDAKPVQLELRRSGVTIQVSSEQTLLDAMIDAGVDVQYGCQVGNCRSCATTVLEGEIDHRDAALSVADREESNLFCPCVSRAKTENLVLDL
jgi:ferredoxin-NADP reductase